MRKALLAIVAIAGLSVPMRGDSVAARVRSWLPAPLASSLPGAPRTPAGVDGTGDGARGSRIPSSPLAVVAAA